jgi:acyl-CoA thioesterase FadM
VVGVVAANANYFHALLQKQLLKRVKIGFPERDPLGVFSIPIRISDINYGGHLGNDRILQLAHEARLQLLVQLGFTELDCGGHSLIMADAEIAFKSEVFYGELLEISVYAGDVTTKGFSMYYRLRKADANQMVVAEVRTGLVAFDYEARRVAELSPTFKSKLHL